jgi:hypothetical protein
MSARSFTITVAPAGWAHEIAEAASRKSLPASVLARIWSRRAPPARQAAA